jgi:hypothetical protein
MAITRFPPNTIWLGGEIVQVNDVAASQPIIPGQLVERFVSTGAKYRRHATAGGPTVKAVALDQSMLNKGVDEAYPVGDLVEVGIFSPGATAWMLVASGQNIANGQKLESAGDGTLRLHASGTPLFAAVEDKDNTTGGSPRIRVEAL